MKLLRCTQCLLFYFLIVVQISFLTSCNTKTYNSKHQTVKTGFLEFYLDMDYKKVKSTMDSLLKNSDLKYFETTDILGATQKNLYYNYSEISPSLYAKVNLRGSYIVDQRLTSIQLTLCDRLKTKGQRFSYNCDLQELKRLFELYEKKYGKPTLLEKGEEYDWLSRRISNVYSPGPKGRWFMDKIYFWEKGNYIIYFDFGYPGNEDHSDNQNSKSKVSELHDSTSVPIIFYDFTPEYIDNLLNKASKLKEKQFQKQQ
jgi:hypothetical protein